MTLNMLQRSRLYHEISFYEQVDVILNFDTIGMQGENHEKPHKQITYAPHSVNGWYIGPAVHPYRCYTFYNIDTGGETTLDTIAFFPEFMKMPNYSTIDMAIRAAADLAKALQTTRPESHFQVVDAHFKAISKLAQISDAETKTPNRDALPTPPDFLMKKRTKLPRV